ncbi:MAG: hypothetical protein NT131_06615 [Methanomassiliicoccales archaeon]|nr:hypothetical protein [Methanomassiliicoccales archaeon]
MRITPAKWDAEYTWLRDEDHIRSIGTSPLITVPRNLGTRKHEEPRETAGVADRNGLGTEHRSSSILDMAMQVIGAFMLLTILGLNGMLLPLLSLGVVLSGEIIFISSLGHGSKRNRSEWIR